MTQTEIVNGWGTLERKRVQKVSEKVALEYAERDDMIPVYALESLAAFCSSGGCISKRHIELCIQVFEKMREGAIVSYLLELK